MVAVWYFWACMSHNSSHTQIHMHKHALGLLSGIFHLNWSTNQHLSPVTLINFNGSGIMVHCGWVYHAKHEAVNVLRWFGLIPICVSVCKPLDLLRLNLAQLSLVVLLFFFFCKRSPVEPSKKTQEGEPEKKLNHRWKKTNAQSVGVGSTERPKKKKKKRKGRGGESLSFTQGQQNEAKQERRFNKLQHRFQLLQTKVRKFRWSFSLKTWLDDDDNILLRQHLNMLQIQYDDCPESNKATAAILAKHDVNAEIYRSDQSPKNFISGC